MKSPSPLSGSLLPSHRRVPTARVEGRVAIPFERVSFRHTTGTTHHYRWIGSQSPFSLPSRSGRRSRCGSSRYSARRLFRGVLKTFRQASNQSQSPFIRVSPSDKVLRIMDRIHRGSQSPFIRVSPSYSEANARLIAAAPDLSQSP